MSFPVGIRKRLGLGGGSTVLAHETPYRVILRTVDQIVAKVQAIARRYARHPDASANAFLATRWSEGGE
jgi:bifunctional DNA-binding transcriptional regulator/antitoxin component of YhaV-PrlF toxin-antitoxin module